MAFDLAKGLEVLQNTPAVLRAWLTGLSDGWLYTNYGPETFSPFDVVGHLIHGEKTDWLPRARRILEHGELVPFDPFDRYAMYADSRGKSIGQLLDEFQALREASLRELRSMRLGAAQLALRGRHPALGSVTLAQLLATWVAHDLNHIHQIAKCMAIQCADQVGPWRDYLGVFPRATPEGA